MGAGALDVISEGAKVFVHVHCVTLWDEAGWPARGPASEPRHRSRHPWRLEPDISLDSERQSHPISLFPKLMC
jgi:hypothetical protein